MFHKQDIGNILRDIWGYKSHIYVAMTTPYFDFWDESMWFIEQVKYVLFGSVYLQTNTCGGVGGGGAQLTIVSYIFFCGGDSTIKLSQMKKLLQLIRNIGPG